MPPDAATQGDRVADRYELRAWLGEGSFGEVWAAHDRADGADVAVKLLRPELGDTPEALRRFDREAQCLARLRHPHVVRLLDRGSWRARPFLVVERLTGGTLLDWTRRHRDRRRPPDLAAVARFFDDACAGVAAAHALDAPGPIVHRDLKPSNLLLDALDPDAARVKVADFGIARLLPAPGDGRGGSTASGAVLGSAHVMAPEQAAGLTCVVGPWTDVFALGVVLVELASLRRGPPQGGWWWGLAMRDEGAVPAALHAMRPGVPTSWWDVVAACLRVRPERRYADAGALREAFRAVMAERRDVPEEPVAPAAPEDEPTLGTRAPHGR